MDQFKHICELIAVRQRYNALRDTKPQSACIAELAEWTRKSKSTIRRWLDETGVYVSGYEMRHGYELDTRRRKSPSTACKCQLT